MDLDGANFWLWKFARCEFPAMKICTVRISGYGNLHLQGSPLRGPVEGPRKLTPMLHANGGKLVDALIMMLGTERPLVAATPTKLLDLQWTRKAKC